MLLEAFVTFSLIFLCFWIYYSQLKKNDNKTVNCELLPPGPKIHPLFGGLSFLTSTPIELVQKWKNTYGNIVTLRLADRDVLLISGHELVKEAFSNPAFCGRPALKDVELVAPSECRRGILNVENVSWVQQRKFVIKNLRDYVFGTKSIEGIIHQECTELISSMKLKLGRPVVIHQDIIGGVLNSLWHTFTGQRFPANELPGISADFNRVVSASFASEVFIPSFKKMLSTTNRELEKSVNNVKQIIQNQVIFHKKTYNKDELRDFMDVYIEEILATKDASSSFYGSIGEENMLASILDLIGGGSQTTSSTILWGLYYITRNKEIQKKFQDEIDLIVGHYRLPSLKDHLEMPYTAAIILETLRLSSILPLGLPHTTVKDVEFQGFKIANGTLVLANLHDIHYDKTIWENPETFSPERFLMPNEKETKKQSSQLIWNSIGKRCCPGEILAKDIIFVFLVSLFQRFNLSTADSKPCNAEGNFLRVPSEFKILAEDRLEFLDRKDLNEHKNNE